MCIARICAIMRLGRFFFLWKKTTQKYWNIIFEIKLLHFLDIEECTSGMHDCDENATCSDEPAYFTCKCNDGYTGNGKTCTKNGKRPINIGFYKHYLPLPIFNICCLKVIK